MRYFILYTLLILFCSIYVLAQESIFYVPGQAIIKLTPETYSSFWYESPKQPFVTTSSSELNNIFSS